MDYPADLPVTPSQMAVLLKTPDAKVSVNYITIGGGGSNRPLQIAAGLNIGLNKGD
jgi:hypothetical protein